MGAFRVAVLPDGRRVMTPKEVTDEELFAHMGVKAVAPAASSPGFTDFVGGALARGAGNIATGAGQALEDSGYSRTGRALRESGEGTIRRNPRITPGFSDAKGLGGTVASLTESTLESVPVIAGGVGATVAAPLLGAGAGVATAAGLATTAGLSGTSSYGGIREQQKRQGIEDIPRAAGASAIVGALDAGTGVGGRIIRGALGRTAINEGRKTFLKETGKTALSEAGTEALQTGIERAGGYQDLTSAEAGKEYLDSAAAGAFGGAVFNTAARGIENRRERQARRAIDDSVDQGQPVELNQWGGYDADGQRELFDSLPPERAGPTRTAEQANPTPADPTEQLNELVRARRQLTNGLAAAEEAGNREQFYGLQDQLSRFDEEYGALAENLAAKANRQRAALGDTQGELGVDVPRGTPPVGPGQNLSDMVFEQSPEGSQGDLFSPIPAPPGQAAAPTQPGTQPPVTGEALQAAANEPTLFDRFPTSTVRSNPRYSLGAVAQAIRGKTAADSYTLRLAKQLTDVLGTGLTGDKAPQAANQAREIIERETEKLVEADARGQLQSKNIDARLKVFENARAVIDAFQSEMTNAQADEQLQNPDNKGVQFGEPVPDATGTIGQINEKNRDTAVAAANTGTVEKVSAAKAEADKAQAAKAAPATDEDFAQATQTVVDGQRNAIIKDITSKPDVTDPFGAIRAAFKKVGLDPSLREEEQNTIEKTVTARAAKQSAAEAFPEPESGVAELEAQIRGEKKPATRPPGPKPTGNNARPASKSPENFKLESQTEADITAREAAQAKRDRRDAARNEPVDNTDPKAQGGLFTAKGNPTAAARQKAAPKPTVSDELKAKKAAKPTVGDKLKAKKAEKPDDEPPPPTKAPVPANKAPDKPNRPVLTPKAKTSGNTSLGDQLRRIASETTAEDAEMSPELRAEYDEVLKEAESYMADDGESGALKPKEYQQLSVLADNETFTPEELRQKLNDLVNRRNEARLAERYGSPSGKSFSVKTAKPAKAITDSPAETTAQNLLGVIATRAKGDLKRIVDTLRAVAPDVKVRFVDQTELMAIHNKSIDASPVPDQQVIGGVYLWTYDTILLDKEHADDETAVHEIVHALTHSRLRDDARVKKLVAELRAKYNTFDPDIYGLTNADEFVAEVWSNPQFREQLIKIGIGNRTAWQRFTDIVRDTLRRVMGKLGQPAGRERVIADIMRVIEATNKPRDESRVARRAGGKRIAEGPAFSVRKVEQTVSKLPEGMQEPALQIADTLNNWASKGLTTLAFTEDLGDLMQGKVPAVRDYFKFMATKEVTRERLNKVTGDVVNAFRKLPQHLQSTGRNTVNSVIQDIDEAGVWVFDPSWLNSEGVTPYTIDGTLRKNVEYARIAGDADAIAKAEAALEKGLATKAAFDRLPAKAQDVIKQAFKHEHDLLVKLKEVVSGNINQVYEADIARERAAGNTAAVAKLEEERADAIGDYQRLMAIDQRRPYASRRRYGDYVAVLKSQALVDAINNNEDKRVIEKMMADPAHYYVQRYDTAREANAEFRKIKRAAAQFNNDNGYAGPADQAQDEFVGGKDMMLAFSRIKNQIGQMAPTASGSTQSINALNRLVSDLYIHSLSSTSARKSELKRLGVAGGDMDMMRNFVTQSRATANLIAALESNENVVDALARVGRQVRQSSDPMTMDAYNELMRRHMGGVNYKPNGLAEATKAMTSVWMLLTKPFYHIQNLLQNPILTMPSLAGRFGYADTGTQMYNAYGQIAAAWDSISTPLDFNKLTDPQAREVIEALADRGVIDIGAQQDLGSFESLSKNPAAAVAETVMGKLRGVTRLTEAINRSSAGVAAYKLARNGNKSLGVKPMTHEQAIDYAHKIIRTTHGSYDAFNAPRFMRSGIGSVVTQFKKFQLMQLGLLARQMHGSLTSMDPIEKAVARRALAFTLTHTAIVSGAMGLPGAATIIWLMDMLLGDDDEPKDTEQELRDGLADTGMADLLLKGVPTMVGIDVSDRLGMGQAFSIIPYVEPELSRSGYEKAAVAMLGPFFGGLAPRMIDGLSMMREGDYWRAGEKLLPGVMADGVRAMREANSGVATRKGDVLVTPEEVSEWDTVKRTLGLNTPETSERMRTQSRVLELEEFYKKRTGNLNRRFVQAKREGDTEELAAVRQEFKDLQDARVKNGFKRQPLSNLIRAERSMKRRERYTVGGVQYPENSPMARRARMERLEQLEAAGEFE